MRRISAESLIELAAATLRTEVQPSVNPKARYALAMTLRALDVARREILADSEAAQWQLLDHVYDDGEGTMDMLSADIRSGKVDDKSHPELRARLEHLLIGELEIRNPQVIKSRSADIA
ncbi:MAG TPA: DUF6285 domain-containing protein [Hyphomicrobiaceae bacterium]|nr:DUF6285 domain-containing protein [Hyphomicrobiaceae bacterium]